MKTATLTGRAAVVSFALLFSFLLAWHLATRGSGTTQHMDPEYAKLMGATATQGKSAMPGPIDVGAKLWEHLRRPFYDNGPNDKGVGIQLAFSIARVLTGYLLAMAVAIPVGFLIGMSPLMSKALDPFIQVLKPISPLAWMPLALYTIKDFEPVGHFRNLHLLVVADDDQYCVWRGFSAARMVERRKDTRSRHLPSCAHDHSAGGGADNPDRHAHLYRDRLASHCRRRNAGRRHGHRLLRLE